MCRAELVDLNGVVDDELSGLERVDLFGVATEGTHSVTHGGQIDDGRHTGEVLHQDACGHVGDLTRGLCLWIPVGQKADVVGRDGVSILVAEEIFEEDAETVRQACEVEGGIEFGESLQAEEDDGGRSGG